MVSSFEVTVPLNIPRDVLWRVRATRAFTQFLVSSGAINRMESTPASPTYETATSQTRTQTYVPKTIQIPEIIKPFFNDSYIEINDTQTWDDETEPFVQQFNIKPAIMGDIVTSTGTLTVDERDNGTCMHKLAGECRVSVPLLGWHIEQAIITNIKHFYKDYGKHIDGFVEMVITNFGDGKIDSLGAAIERLCAEEKEAPRPE